MNVYGLLVNPAFFRRKTKGFNPCFCVGCKFQHNLTGLTPEGAQPQLQEVSWQGLMDVWMSTSISAGEACKACSIWPSTCSLVPTNGYKWHPLQKSWTPLVSLHWWWNPDMDGEFPLTTSYNISKNWGSNWGYNLLPKWNGHASHVFGMVFSNSTAANSRKRPCTPWAATWFGDGVLSARSGVQILNISNNIGPQNCICKQTRLEQSLQKFERFWKKFRNNYMMLEENRTPNGWIMVDFNTLWKFVT